MTDDTELHGLSTRGWNNVEGVIPKIPKNILEAGTEENDQDLVDMSVAENWLIRDELAEIQKAAIEKEWNLEIFSWPKGFWGDPTLLKELAAFFNRYFSPYTPVLDSDISLAPGVANSLDAVLFNICNDGDGVLCPAPYWNGYDTFFRLRPGVTPVPVELDSLDDESSFLKRMDDVLATSQYRIKGLVLANPHNPLGRCYSKETLERCLEFCQKHDIHLVSDEIFGPFTFGSTDGKHRRPFTSVLSIDLGALKVSPWRVHVLWGPSKVFALAGPRIVSTAMSRGTFEISHYKACTITQGNKHMRNALTLASFATVSSLSILLTKELLRSPKLPEIISVYEKRWLNSYQTITEFLKRLRISYYECNSGPFVLARLAPDAKSWDDESEVIERLKEAKVWVSPGKSHHLPENEKGWARLTFALEPETLRIGLERIERVLGQRTEMSPGR